MVDNALENNTLKIVIADGAYDSKENFRYLYDNNIKAPDQGKEELVGADSWSVIQGGKLYFNN